MIISRREKREGEYSPPFWYGRAYEDFQRSISVWYPIPFNWIIRFQRFLGNKWLRVRGRISKRDAEVYRAIQDARHRSYHQGLKEATENVMRELSSLSDKQLHDYKERVILEISLRNTRNKDASAI